MDIVEAYYVHLNPSRDFVQKVYRSGWTKMNDGTMAESLQYWGEQGGWHGSLNEPREEFIKTLDRVHESEAMYYINQGNNGRGKEESL